MVALLTTSWLRTPIDDTHTMVFIVGEGYRVREGANLIETEDAIVEYLPALKEPADALHPAARFNFYAPFGQIADQERGYRLHRGRGLVLERDVAALLS